MRYGKCAGCRKEKCDGCSLWPGKEIGSKKNEMTGIPVEFLKDNREGYGIAFDVGTTTVAGILWDLREKKMLGAETLVNPQRVAGSDVVSRISYCMKRDENAQELHRLIVSTVDEMARRLINTFAQGQEGIKEVVVVGNTAMCEIFGGVSTEGLWKAPFKKEYRKCLKKRGDELGLEFLKEVQITVLPCIDGYVGADALSVYAYVRGIDSRKNVLAVDIGTNGEILLIGQDKVFACSAAAGPALEGAAVTKGMGAAPGAVEEVRLLGSFPREDIYCKVIGECNPKGICGSGLVDALALLRKLHVIDKSGYLRSREEARRAGVKERICQRIIEKEGKRQFLLTNEEYPVSLAAGDIRQLQLAKGAIRAATQVLLEKAGIGLTDITHIYLAGAFGSYIKISSALQIGLLPNVSDELVTHTGNCAAQGAAMALFSERLKAEMEEWSEEILHVELAKEEQFQEYFLKYMEMP